jgi:hypothetical protein
MQIERPWPVETTASVRGRRKERRQMIGRGGITIRSAAFFAHTAEGYSGYSDSRRLGTVGATP